MALFQNATDAQIFCERLCVHCSMFMQRFLYDNGWRVVYVAWNANPSNRQLNEKALNCRDKSQHANSIAPMR